MKKSTRNLLLFGSLTLLLLHEAACVYFVMPFPGSQEFDVVEGIYLLQRYGVLIRTTLLGTVALTIWKAVRAGIGVPKILTIIALLLYGVLFFGIRYAMTAESIFQQPVEKRFLPGLQDSAQADKIVIAVTINGESAAYPIQLLGYHHQVRDTVGGQPILVTYCTVCRTGRVYSLVLNGKHEQFRLVGMDHYNAMFEDATTGSWWRQATGECVAGPLKGTFFDDVPYQQVSLRAWLRDHPDTRVLQPDRHFSEQYKHMRAYESGQSRGALTMRDTGSWQRKSWVIGLSVGSASRTYDWNNLQRRRIVEDTVSGTPLMLVLETDDKSFHAYHTTVEGQRLRFSIADSAHLIDSGTESIWTFGGQCISGPMQGKRLQRIQAHQEYLHSWEQFHPEAKRVQ